MKARRFTVNLRLPIVEQPQNSTSGNNVETRTGRNAWSRNRSCWSARTPVLHARSENKLQRRGYQIKPGGRLHPGAGWNTEGPHRPRSSPIWIRARKWQLTCARSWPEARQRQIKTIGISDTPASLDHNLTALVEVLVITPGPWDDLLREVGICHHRRRSQNIRRRLEHVSLRWKRLTVSNQFTWLGAKRSAMWCIGQALQQRRWADLVREIRMIFGCPTKK